MADTILIDKEEYENMKETLNVLSDSKLIKSIAAGVEDIKKGKTISLKEFLKR